MGIFRTFVGAIALMMTMFYLWTQSGSLTPYLSEMKDVSIYMGYPIISNLERLILSDDRNSTEDNTGDDEDETEFRSESLIRTPLLHPKDNTTKEQSVPSKRIRDEKASETIRQQTTLENVNSSSCFSYDDSKEYWNATLLRNIDHDRRMVDATYLYKTLLDPWSEQVVNQTICHDSSRFLDPIPEHLTDRDWEARLLYLGLYLHQHLPAMKDLETRKSCQADDNLNLSPFNITSSGDYQCHPDTKYLVVSLPSKGAGATFRSGAVPALLAGLAMKRVVVFVNDRPVGSIQMRSRWPLASRKSCPRGDIQCYFLPVTPCVLTEAEVRNATQFAINSAVAAFGDGRPGRGMHDYRIIVADAKSSPMALWDKAEMRMRTRVHELVKDLAVKYGAPKHVLEQLLVPYTKQTQDLNSTDRYANYNRGGSVVHHAAHLYLMRPNWNFRQEINDAVRRALPKNFNPNWSFGIPIRGKSNKEMFTLFDS